MSRVYEALCQSREEHGLPETFLPSADSARDVFVSETGPDPSPEQTRTFQPSSDPASRLVALQGGSTLGAEKFRLLRSRLRQLQDRSPLKSMVITSATPQEGKTLVACNIAISLSRHSTQKVLLLDGDLHKPTVAERLGLTGCIGLTEWFDTPAPLPKFVYRLSESPLYVLPAGTLRDEPLAILQSPRFVESFERLTRIFDWIVIDAPPLSPLADVSVWSRMADGILLVVREGKTPRSALKAGLDTLDHPRILGIVMNESHATGHNYYDSYYHPEKSSTPALT